MSPRRESLAFSLTLAVALGGFFAESLVGGRVLSPADVIAATPGFESLHGPGYEPANRLLIDPVLQFQPWLEFNRAELRSGRLPLWNPLAGCGAPHLANGQSAVFDPFHLIAYLGRLPDAYAVMAWSRLWFAGLGMFRLARAWGLGPWGRWFGGLTFPLCGFLVVWLLFPVTATAVWMPWVFLATDRVIDRPSSRSAGWLALTIGGMLLGGHVQTAAHVLMAVGAYASWRLFRAARHGGGRDLVIRGAAGLVAIGVGVALAAIEVVPLAFYLARSPVWSDREAAKPSPATLVRPRLLDAVCTALPYAYGSQRRGHPNLAKALGVHNLNESAGGFAGLATLLWLAPAAWSARRTNPRVGFLAALVAVGTLGAFEIPPMANLLRAVPVLDVIDHRRLTLWTAFGLVLLGGVGLDRLGRPGWGPRVWALAGALLIAGAIGFGPACGARLHARAIDHYQRAAAATLGADPKVFRDRAERQARQALAFVPRYGGLVAAQLIALAGLALAWRSGRIDPTPTRLALMSLVLTDLVGFGFGLNPATPRSEGRPEPELIDYLRREAAPPARVLALGAILPPNTCMSYGLADLRNYDSVESSRSLAYFTDLYEPGASRTSRREVTWNGVARSLDRLHSAWVAAVVGPTPPPPGLFPRVDRVGNLWVGRLVEEAPRVGRPEPGRIEVAVPAGHVGPVVVAETFDPGWRAVVDGRAARVEPHDGAFLAVATRPRERRVVLRYDPPEVRAALACTGGAAMVVALMISGGLVPERGRKKGSGSWSASSRRVRIGGMIPIRSSSPVPTEG
jgi:hypothetical protein